MLVHPPASPWRFDAPGGPGVWAHDHVWVPLAGRVIAWPCATPPSVSPAPDGSVAVHLASGDVLDVRAESVHLQPSARPGGPAALVRRTPRGFALPFPLPVAAQRSPKLMGFGQGAGAVWVDGGCLYRHRVEDHSVQALGWVHPSEAITVGPQGAVLVGDGAYTRGAPPRRVLAPLPVPLAQHGPIRWRTDGRVVAGTTEDDPDAADAAVLHLVTGQHRTVSRHVPQSTDVMCALGREGTGITTPSMPAAFGRWLAGPGGKLWHMDDLSRHTESPCLGPGPHLAVDRAWLTAGPGGTLRWLDREGHTLRRHALDLELDDEIDRLTFDGTQVIAHTWFGAVHPVPCPAKVRPRPRDATTSEDVPEAWAPLGFDRCFVRDAHRLLTGPHGALVRLPRSRREAATPR